MLEGQVDDSIGGRGGLPEAVKVVKAAPAHVGAGRRQRGGGLIRAGQADDLMSSVEQFGDEGRADVPGRPGDEDAHRKTSRWSGVPPRERAGRCQSLPSLYHPMTATV